jgi:hypothetical protein
MGVPASGLVLIPLTLGIFVFSSYLAEWAIFCAVLQSAALVNVGGGFAVGLSPYFFVTALMASRIVPQWATGRIRFFPEEPVANHLRILGIFMIWCVFSAFALPVLFDGLPVDSPRLGVDQSYYIQSPLHWSPSNGGQAGYMVLNFVMVLGLLQLATRPGRLQRLATAFSWSGVLVVGVGAYQVFGPRVGLPFPAWFFNSNQAWAQLPNQLIGDNFSRMSATFPEPSEAAAFLAAWSVFQLSLAIAGDGRRNRWAWLWASVGSVALVKTASTTGYVTAGIIWAVMVCDCGATILRHGWIKKRATLAVLGLTGAAILALVIGGAGAWHLLDAVLFHKGDSKSAEHRTATFGRAVQVFQNSWGLGAGLGSNRAMSVFFYVLSNLGIPGIALMVILLVQLYTQIRRRIYRPGADPTVQGLMTAAASALVANVISLLASGAEITQPRLWILWGLLLATIRCDWLVEEESLGRIQTVHEPQPDNSFSIDPYPLGLRKLV